jgi:hypothetical protein
MSDYKYRSIQKPIFEAAQRLRRMLNGESFESVYTRSGDENIASDQLRFEVQDQRLRVDTAKLACVALDMLPVEDTNEAWERFVDAGRVMVQQP